MSETLLENIINKTPPRVAVIGAAKSGVAAARYFCARGSRVFVSDTCSREKLDVILRENNLTADNIDSEAVSHSEKILENDLIILSPGVRADLDILKKAALKNIAVWSEMELGFRVSKAPFLAVTGSSGKSTTVSLLHSAMCEAGFDAHLAGNIGTPVIDVVPTLSERAVVIAEVSSFQLETIHKFKPKVAAVINLMKNHLDRYADENEYYNAKKRIADNLTNNECIVLNADDVRLAVWAKEFARRTHVVTFGAGEVGNDDHVYLSNGKILYRYNGTSGQILDDVSKMKIGGRHNYINACAAAATALAYGADAKRIGEGLCKFGGLAHRLEFVAEINGVEFYNDSKSTTAESIECAVTAFGQFGTTVKIDASDKKIEMSETVSPRSKKIHLIAGGKDKGCDFTVINNAIRENVKSVILIGEAKDRMADVWKNIAPITKVETLDDAVSTAHKNATAGEKIVFSPGCSSFDMFTNYEHRGEAYKKIVNEKVASEKS